MKESHLDDIKKRMRAVDLLRLLKNSGRTYQFLSEITNLPVTVLNRYVKGHVLPSTERSAQLMELFNKKFDLPKLVEDTISFDKNGHLNNIDLLSNVDLLGIIAEYVAQKFSNDGVNKILSVAVDGIPIATLIAREMKVELVFAKSRKEVGISKYMEETYAPRSSGVLTTFYLPKKSLDKKSRVLIVDDIIRSGLTQQLLINMCRRVNCEVVGLFFIISIGSEWKSVLKKDEKTKLEILLELQEPK
ncbi:MAG: phosphoribosyltransferase family protein [Candidatus Helarchaeota archaeon]